MYIALQSDVCTVTIEFVVRKNLHLDCAIKVIFIVLRRFCHKRLTGVGQTAFGLKNVLGCWTDLPFIVELSVNLLKSLHFSVWIIFVQAPRPYQGLLNIA